MSGRTKVIRVGMGMTEAKNTMSDELVSAIRTGNCAEVAALVKDSADANAHDENGNTALHFAVLYGCTEAAQLLIDRGADVNARNRNGYTALHFAAQTARTEMARLLIESGADVNQRDDHGATALHYAAVEGRTDLFKLLVESGADTEVRDESGNTPLYYALGNSELANLTVSKAKCGLNLREASQTQFLVALGGA